MNVGVVQFVRKSTSKRGTRNAMFARIFAVAPVRSNSSSGTNNNNDNDNDDIDNGCNRPNDDSDNIDLPQCNNDDDNDTFGAAVESSSPGVDESNGDSADVRVGDDVFNANAVDNDAENGTVCADLQRLFELDESAPLDIRQFIQSNLLIARDTPTPLNEVYK